MPVLYCSTDLSALLSPMTSPGVMLDWAAARFEVALMTKSLSCSSCKSDSSYGPLAEGLMCNSDV